MPISTRRYLFPLLALSLGPFEAAPLPAEIHLPGQQGPGLFELAQQVSTGDETQQNDFAWIALSELLAAYEGEAVTSRQAKASDRKARQKLSRWRSATWAFSEQLRQRLDALQNGAPVRVHAQRPNPVMISIGGQPTVISGPNAGEDRQLEQRIVLNYCWLHACDIGPAPEPAEPRNAAADDSGGQWDYRQGRHPEYSTGDGLVFEFRRIDNYRAAGVAADQLAAELRELATQLGGVRSLGTLVDWDNLQLLPREGQDQHWVLLNQNGDYLRTNLPQLFRNPDLLREAGPWLSGQAQGAPGVLQIRRAERFTQHLEAGAEPR